nr:protoporphyrinogen oxidase [Onthophagus taurus]
MSRIIVGGGISGLSAAYYAMKQPTNQPLIVLEATDRFGGWLKTTRLIDGTIFEQAARTIRPSGISGANTLQLVEELGLGDEIMPVSKLSPAAKNRMIYANGSLHSLPNSLMGLFRRQEPFSKPLIYYLMNDVITPKKHVLGDDESLYSFASRRFGNEVADYLISPVVCGICGGDAKEISVKFLMKPLFEKEQRYGSVLQGLFFDGLTKKRENLMDSRLLLRSRSEKWNVYSFKNGIEVLPRTLKKKLDSKGIDIRANTKIVDVELNKHSVICKTESGDCIVGNEIISSIPAFELSTLLKNHHPELASILASIQYASMCVVNLQYNGKVIPKEGFGFLVAPNEESALLGVIFDSCCFPYRETTVLTAMIGGYKYHKYINNNTSEKEMEIIALKELKRMLKLDEKPQSVKVQFLKNCIPQYMVGHEMKVKEIEGYIKRNRLPLAICGSSYYGVGVNDVIFSAKKAIDEIRD